VGYVLVIFFYLFFCRCSNCHFINVRYFLAVFIGYMKHESKLVYKIISYFYIHSIHPLKIISAHSVLLISYVFFVRLPKCDVVITALTLLSSGNTSCTATIFNLDCSTKSLLCMLSPQKYLLACVSTSISL